MGHDGDAQPENYDVFVSYAHRDGARVAPLVAALRSSGLRVWFDESDIPVFDSITRCIFEGISKAKAVVAFYSKTYPMRSACGLEMMAAFLTAREEDPRRRILVINPFAREYRLVKPRDS